MTPQSAEATTIETLTEREFEALVGGATWYAKYHQTMMAHDEDDRSSLAASRREHFEALHAALRKLGVRLRRPS